MLFITHQLVRRLELAETEDGLGCVTAQKRLDPASTAIYLTITPQLLAEANQRFEAFAEPVCSEGQR